jgi:hypothetical protein
VLDLPGLAPPDWVTMEVDGRASHGHFVHSEGSKDEWSLTWTKLDKAEHEWPSLSAFAHPPLSGRLLGWTPGPYKQMD